MRPFLRPFPKSMGANASKLRPTVPSGGSLKLQQQQQQRAVFMRLPPTHQYQRFQRRERSAQHLWGNPNFGRFVGAVILGGGTFYVYNLETVPVSGRLRFNFFNTEMEAQMAQQAYAEVKESYRGQILSSYHPTTRYVKRVMDRLVPVSGLEDLKWEVFVIKDNSIKNAFVIPGGKVFVFSGILGICGGEDGLAAIMSHEIAHTVAHHASETMSKSFLAIAALFLLSVVSGTNTSFLGNIMDLTLLRPGSRRQEADYIGLMMMAEACYDPSGAVGLWERMEKAQEFETPQFLSTHPSHKSRIRNIKEWMPEALQKLENSECAGRTMDYALEFRKAFGYPSW
ncbi:hypothetical protein C7212DRAFT_287477 [Tuber magnatum]|uniref:Peptidase M48 domain-containing protein n=1 Tax=Tuber magnatum TaxID=42249 RepID=A0A317SBF4_9PEZI|nr:hypothetical protein C7212DRAFT_287477 [Tuber magnatum]